MATGMRAALPDGPQMMDNGQYFNPAAFARTPQFQFGNASRYLPDVRNPATSDSTFSSRSSGRSRAVQRAIPHGAV
jgi:hypothetical protein